MSADTPAKDGSKDYRSGYIALIGNPNAGKSTLMNRFLGSRISITTHKPQTTRHQILGIYSDSNSQMIFLDTPGVLTPAYELQEVMMRFVDKAKKDADIILFIVDGTDTTPPRQGMEFLSAISKPVWLVINKSDRTPKKQAAQLEKEIREKVNVVKSYLISALHGEGTEKLLNDLRSALPPGPPYYPDDILSEQPMRFFAAELIREQIFLQFHEEIPYSCTVEVIQYEEQEELDMISANIVVNRKSQKGMLIGKGGKAIRQLGISARESIEAFTGRKAYLDLHVKVREKWREKADWVRNLGYSG